MHMPLSRGMPLGLRGEPLAVVSSFQASHIVDQQALGAWGSAQGRWAEGPWLLGLRVQHFPSMAALLLTLADIMFNQ